MAKSRLRFALVVLSIGALTLSALVQPAIDGVRADALGSVSGVQSGDAPCVDKDKFGRQRWVGEPVRDSVDVASLLQAVVDANHASATGVALCSHYEGVEVFVPAAVSSNVLDAIADARQRFPQVPIAIVTVDASLGELIDLSTKVMRALPEGIEVVSMGPDIYTGGLDVGVDASNTWPEAATELLQGLITRLRGAALPLTVRDQQGKAINSTRAADSAPYYMGAELLSGGFACSAGVPITVNGTKKMLTAGHCSGASFTNNGSVVGTQYTSSYPGNADVYGDWKLLQGSSYGLRVFNGALSSNSSIPISGGNWGARPNGYQICVSGRTTGQTCRYFVTGSYYTFTAEGVPANHQMLMQHDNNLDGVYDSSGWSGGDSGGPCYYSDGSGGVIVNGIVRGRAIPQSGPTAYYCTQLSGVRAWSLGTQVG